MAAAVGLAAMFAVAWLLFLLGGFATAPTGWKVLTLTLAAGAGLLGFRRTPHLLWAGLRAADAAVEWGLWLPVRLKLEGTLLAVGTALFLLSKALAWGTALP